MQLLVDFSTNHPALAGVAALVFLLLLFSLRIANQYERAVVFFLGRYARTSGPGLYLLTPFLEWQSTVDLRTDTTSVEQQETITRDNVPIKINAVIWRRVVDPARSLIEVTNVGDAVTQVAITALRGIIGQHSLDDVLKAQDTISEALQATIDKVTEPWGVKVERVRDEECRNPRQPCSAPWRRKPRRCARSARAASRPRRRLEAAGPVEAGGA